MKPMEFPEQTEVIAKNQPQYRPLPAYRFKEENGGEIVCCWKLTWRERVTIMVSGKLWHSILTFNRPLQPQWLSVKKPVMP